MTAYNSFKIGGAVGTVNEMVNRALGYQSIQFDVAKFVAVNAFVSGDSENIISIPARSQLILYGVVPDTTLVLGTTPSFNLGDSAAATTFINASANVTAGTFFALAATSKTYATADTLKVTISNASGTVTSGTFTIVYAIVDLSANPVAQASVSV